MSWVECTILAAKYIGLFCVSVLGLYFALFMCTIAIMSALNQKKLEYLYTLNTLFNQQLQKDSNKSNNTLDKVFDTIMKKKDDKTNFN